MALVAYRVAMRGPLHLGAGRAGDLAGLDGLPRSDTIAAAIISLWRHVVPGASLDDVARVAAQAPFAVSSMLPTMRIAGQWQTLLFAPAAITDRIAGLSSSRHKALRGIRYADINALRSLLDGKLPERWSTDGQAFVTGELTGELWSHRTRPRTAVDRISGGAVEGTIYDFGAIQLGERVRLTVLVDFIDDSCRNGVEAALALLGDEGIGGERSAGYGGFRIEHIEQGFAAELGSGAMLTLSLLHPSRDEVEAGLLDPPAEYLIASRGGWATTARGAALRRKTVSMIAEGSILRDLGHRRYGTNPVVVESGGVPGVDHPVFRPGAAVVIPIKRLGA
jgi:CRISPR-associated protein Csm4